MKQTIQQQLQLLDDLINHYFQQQENVLGNFKNQLGNHKKCYKFVKK